MESNQQYKSSISPYPATKNRDSESPTGGSTSVADTVAQYPHWDPAEQNELQKNIGIYAGVNDSLVKAAVKWMKKLSEFPSATDTTKERKNE